MLPKVTQDMRNVNLAQRQLQQEKNSQQKGTDDTLVKKTKNVNQATQTVTNSAHIHMLVNDTTSDSSSNSSTTSKNGESKAPRSLERGKKGRKSADKQFGLTLFFAMAMLALLMTC